MRETGETGIGEYTVANPDSGQCILVHDGSFPGFLCAVAEAINRGHAGFPLPLVRSRAESGELFDEPLVIPRDDLRAARLWARLSRRAGEAALLTCFEAFCSDLAGKEPAICQVLVRMLKEGGIVLDDLSCPHVGLVEKAAIRTCAQVRLVTGLLRFAELVDGSWYAGIEPECNILTLIADHFAVRFPAMSFAIHDRKRGEAILHHPGKPWRLVSGFSIGLPAGIPSGFLPDGSAQEAFSDANLPLSAEETMLRTSWAHYFSSVVIKERTNFRLQASRMPKKYWKDLPEMQVPPGHQALCSTISLVE